MRAFNVPESQHRPETIDRAGAPAADSSLSTAWTSALERIAEKLTPQNFDMWLRPIECLSIESGRVCLRAPNSYVRWWFEVNYLSIVLEELRIATGSEFEVEFAPEADAAGEPNGAPADTNSPEARETVPPEPAPQPTIRAREPAPPPTLNPRYTFDTFVAGPSNQLAYAASHAAASTYPPKYNPVFICGGVGLGKTHLLHAIGHVVAKNRPGARILYISGEQFMNEYIQAIRGNRMHEFRRRYREGCDALLVDDVQFLAGKDGTQDEFFHTFNALHDSHRQIVLTADRKPHEISDIADRLRTRFQWGLLADIEPPELEVRVAILRQKAAAEGISLADDVVMYIATAIKSNVRELEGALIRLAAYASLSGKSITLDFARQTLEGSLAPHPEHISVERVLRAVAGYYNIKIADLKSPRRHKTIAHPRAVAMYLARQHTRESYPDLGRSFGGKHHTTVLSAVEKVGKRLKSEPGLRGEIHAIESLLLR
jgi:chromosomal replication initiator protein